MGCYFFCRGFFWRRFLRGRLLLCRHLLCRRFFLLLWRRFCCSLLCGRLFCHRGDFLCRGFCRRNKRDMGLFPYRDRSILFLLECAGIFLGECPLLYCAEDIFFPDESNSFTVEFNLPFGVLLINYKLSRFQDCRDERLFFFSLPFSVLNFPGPMATITPSRGFSFATSGMMMPPAVLSFGSDFLITAQS